MKLPKFSIYAVIGIFLAIVTIAVLVGAASADIAHLSPLDQYIVSRQCDFIQLGELSAASCTDGTIWNVAPWVP